MSENRDNLSPERRERIRRRRRLLLWVLGATVLLLLALDTQLRRVRSLPVYLRPQSAQVAARACGATTRFENKDASTGLFHLDQLFADHGDGRLLIPVSQSLAGEVVQSVSGRDRAAGD